MAVLSTLMLLAVAESIWAFDQDADSSVLQPGIVEEIQGSDLQAPASGDSLLQPGIVEDITEGENGLRELLRVGGISRSPISIEIDFSAYYDDNVFITDIDRSSSYVFEFVPGVYFESSRPESNKQHYLWLSYAPLIRWFSDLSDLDSSNHRGYARYQFDGSWLDVEFDHRSEQFSEASRDIGRRSEGDRHFTRLESEIEFMPGGFIEASFERQALNFDNEGLSDWDDRWVDAFLLLDVARKLRLGPGVRRGWVDVDDAPNQVYLQALGLLRYVPNPKWEFQFSGGVEFRSFEGAFGASDSDTAVFEGVLLWMPRESTRVSLTGYRNVRVSAGGDNFVETGILGFARQRIHRRIHYTLGGGFENADYEATTRGANVVREDNYLVLRNGLDYDLGEKTRVGLFYEFRHNDSNVNANFRRNATGFNVQIEF